MDLSKKQKILFDFLKNNAADGALKMTNPAISRELTRLRLYAPAPSSTAISMMLGILVKKNLIRLEYPGDTKARVIYILDNQI